MTGKCTHQGVEAAVSPGSDFAPPPPWPAGQPGAPSMPLSSEPAVAGALLGTACLEGKGVQSGYPTSPKIWFRHMVSCRN